MIIATNIVVAVAAFMQFYIMFLEMVLWTKPRGRRIFGQSVEQANTTAVMAANQGLYNGFLGAGLVWAIAHPVPEVALQLKIFFLGCMAFAGFYGVYSTGLKNIYLQAVPPILGLILVFL